MFERSIQAANELVRNVGKSSAKETSHRMLKKKARQIRMSGFRRLLFWKTSSTSARRGMLALLVFASIMLTACGGGSGGSSDSGVDPTTNPGSQTESEDLGSIVATVRDVFGEPVTGANVYVRYISNPHHPDYLYGSAISDSSGRATILKVPAGVVQIAATMQSPVSLYGQSDERNLDVNGQLDFELTLLPAPETGFSMAIGRAKVEPDGIQENGRVLEFTVNLFLIPSDANLDGLAFSMPDCTPNSTGDSSETNADCIEDASGFDAPYEVVNGGVPIRRTDIPGGVAEPFAATVLIDQGGHVFAIDPSDARLYGAKYLLATMSTGSRIALAAFSSTDSPSGEHSVLPQEPVTFYPEAEPQFYTSASDLYATIDALGDYEGGVSPLYEAIDKALDFTATNIAGDGRRAVIVFTDGIDDTCGSAETCRIAQRAVAEKSLATAIKVIVIGQAADEENYLWLKASGDAALPVPGHVATLRTWPEISDGLTAWVVEQDQIAMVFGRLGPILDGSAAMTELRFRIESTSDNTFQSGRAVLGKLTYETCGVFCYGVTVPVAIQIP